MNKSLVLLASFAGLVACFGDKKSDEPTAEGQATETCPAPAVEEKKSEEPAAAPAETTTTETTAQ